MHDPFGHDDETYRTCAECGGDCTPELMESSAGMSVAFCCPIHGLHSVIDPFEDLD